MEAGEVAGADAIGIAYLACIDGRSYFLRMVRSVILEAGDIAACSVYGIG